MILLRSCSQGLEIKKVLILIGQELSLTRGVA